MSNDNGETPAPLTTPEIDVRNLDGFMLNVERLLASELVAIGAPEECWAALMLWCRAWKQVPAGSLPDDDRVLASYSGARERWPEVKEMALRGFIKCSDGRLYHRFLCPVAAKAFASKQTFEARREADRKRLKEWRDKQTRNDGETRFETADETRFVQSVEVKGEVEVEVKEDKKEGRRARGAPAEGYAFEGDIIRLTRADFDKWRESFSAIEHLDAELRTIDAKLVDEGVDGNAKWFGKVAGWLRAKNERIRRDRKSRDGSSWGAPGFA